MKTIVLTFSAACCLAAETTQASLLIDDFSDNVSVTANGSFTGVENPGNGRDYAVGSFDGVNAFAKSEDGVGKIFGGNTGASILWDGMDPAPNHVNQMDMNLNLNLSTYDRFLVKLSSDTATAIGVSLYSGGGSEFAFATISVSAGDLDDLNDYSISFSDFLANNPNLDFSDISGISMSFGGNLNSHIDDFMADAASPVPEARHYGLMSGALCLAVVLFRKKGAGSFFIRPSLPSPSGAAAAN
jgi:hypothetical protein